MIADFGITQLCNLANLDKEIKCRDLFTDLNEVWFWCTICKQFAESSGSE